MENTWHRPGLTEVTKSLWRSVGLRRTLSSYSSETVSEGERVILWA
jgi:hypothetical protein